VDLLEHLAGLLGKNVSYGSSRLMEPGRSLRTGLRLSVEVRLFWVVASMMMFRLCFELMLLLSWIEFGLVELGRGCKSELRLI
jgi:hypothetical protein